MERYSRFILRFIGKDTICRTGNHEAGRTGRPTNGLRMFELLWVN